LDLATSISPDKGYYSYSLTASANTWIKMFLGDQTNIYESVVFNVFLGYYNGFNLTLGEIVHIEFEFALTGTNIGANYYSCIVYLANPNNSYTHQLIQVYTPGNYVVDFTVTENFSDKYYIYFYLRHGFLADKGNLLITVNKIYTSKQRFYWADRSA
jgi:hypothetical protein